MRSIKSPVSGTVFAQLFAFAEPTNAGQYGESRTTGAMSTSIKRRNENELTYSLKWAAWRWLYQQAGCKVVGFEVRLEGPSGRIADVVGVDRANRVYLIEVKASRPDLMKDHHTQRDRRRLAEDSRGLAEAATFALELAGAADGSAATELAAISRDSANARRERAERRLDTFSTKFHEPAYLRAADFHYLMAPHGLVWPGELPPFWGLLNERGEQVAVAPPKQIRRVTAHVLRAIGKANTRDLMKACGQEIERRHTPAAGVDSAVTVRS